MDIFKRITYKFKTQLLLMSSDQKIKNFIEEHFDRFEENLKRLIEHSSWCDDNKIAILDLLEHLCGWAKDPSPISLRDWMILINETFHQLYGNPFVNTPEFLESIKISAEELKDEILFTIGIGGEKCRV